MAKLININKPIRATTETAFQRAIFFNGKTILGSKTEIKWLDIELPVDTDGKRRRHCVDLIGIIGNRYVICELKFGKDFAAERPDTAATQIKDYYDSIRKNWKDLDNKNIHHPDGKTFNWKDVASSRTILCVAANAGYWAYWLGHRKVDISEIKDVKFYSEDITTDTFKNQKGKQQTYLPKLDSSCWDIL